MTRSKAFLPIGTQTIFAGRNLAEVRTIGIVKEGVRVVANFVPTDEAQVAVIQALQNEWLAELQVILPQGTTLTIHGIVSGEAKIACSEVATITFIVNGEVKVSTESIDSRVTEPVGAKASGQ